MFVLGVCWVPYYQLPKISQSLSLIVFLQVSWAKDENGDRKGVLTPNLEILGSLPQASLLAVCRLSLTIGLWLLPVAKLLSARHLVLVVPAEMMSCPHP